jgi:hypothetical protein
VVVRFEADADAFFHLPYLISFHSRQCLEL